MLTTHPPSNIVLQAAIVDSLQRYTSQIEDLKREMDEATQIAGARCSTALFARKPGRLSVLGCMCRLLDRLTLWHLYPHPTTQTLCVRT